MTAHAAKGLEFSQVFILRASSPSFPSPYKEPLLEFPRELHDAGSIAQDDDKELWHTGQAPRAWAYSRQCSRRGPPPRAADASVRECNGSGQGVVGDEGLEPPTHSV